MLSHQDLFPRPWPASRPDLKGWRWFQCRFCWWFFIVGPALTTDVRVEAQKAAAHEAACYAIR